MGCPPPRHAVRGNRAHCGVHVHQHLPGRYVSNSLPNVFKLVSPVSSNCADDFFFFSFPSASPSTPPRPWRPIPSSVPSSAPHSPSSVCPCKSCNPPRRFLSLNPFPNGSFFPLEMEAEFSLPRYNTLGLGWGNSLLAFIALAMCPIPLLFYCYGEKLRTHPRFRIQL